MDDKEGSHQRLSNLEGKEEKKKEEIELMLKLAKQKARDRKTLI
jgi:hypothetical protein